MPDQQAGSRERGDIKTAARSGWQAEFRRGPRREVRGGQVSIERAYMLAGGNLGMAQKGNAANMVRSLGCVPRGVQNLKQNAEDEPR